MHEDADSWQELSKVEAGRAGYLMVPHSVDGLGDARDIDVAAEGIGELSSGAHGHTRRDTARAEVDEGAISGPAREGWRFIQEAAVDGAVPGSGSLG